MERTLTIGEKILGGDKSLMQCYAGPYALMLLHAGRADEALTVAQSALATQQAASNGKDPWIKFTDFLGALKSQVGYEPAQHPKL